MSCHRSWARGTMCAPRAAAAGLRTALMPCSVATICNKGALIASCSFCPLALNRRGWLARGAQASRGSLLMPRGRVRTSAQSASSSRAAYWVESRAGSTRRPAVHSPLVLCFWILHSSSGPSAWSSHTSRSCALRTPLERPSPCSQLSQLAEAGVLSSSSASLVASRAGAARSCCNGGRSVPCPSKRRSRS
ncbi:hypothetical protein D3C85_780070 [compost metagenome]